jgi:hypothetical protein
VTRPSAWERCRIAVIRFTPLHLRSERPHDTVLASS